MTNRLRLSVSAAALALLMAGGASSVQAADVIAEPGCSLNGSVMAGYMYNWQEVSNELSFDSAEIEEKDFDLDLDSDVDWETPFGEGAALFTCGGLNIQADFAYYNHETEVSPGFDEKDDFDFEQTHMHGGGALFYRDPGNWAGGISASLINQDLEGKDNDIFRIGLFGEFYFDDFFTLGASGHYYDTDHGFDGKDGNDLDEDGFELAVWGRFYATPNFSLMLRGDLLLPSTEFDFDDEGEDFDTDFNVDDGWAVTGEAEYLVWEYGLSIFGGARYAERSWDFSVQDDDGDEFTFDSDVEDFQVFAGLKFYFDFGRERTLLENHRTGAFDNTSVFHEKLPEMFTSTAIGLVQELDEGIIVAADP